MLLKAPFKFLLLLALSAVLSWTIVFGALPMRVTWRSFGRVPYWIGHLAVAAGLAVGGLASFALAFFALTVLVGIYSDVEDHGSTVFTAGFVGIIAAIGSSALGIGAWLHFTKANLLAELKAYLVPWVERMESMNPGTNLEVDTILQQLPSVAVMMLMVAIAFALIWERRWLAWFRLPQSGLLLSSRLMGFRVSDLTVWIVMLAILGAGLNHGHKWLEVLSINAINVFLLLYFFQGLAVVTAAFQTFKVSPFWQGIWYVLIVLQLFLLVSFLGFADYWLDFRERMSRKPAETNKSF